MYLRKRCVFEKEVCVFERERGVCVFEREVCVLWSHLDLVSHGGSVDTGLD